MAREKIELTRPLLHKIANRRVQLEDLYGKRARIKLQLRKVEKDIKDISEYLSQFEITREVKETPQTQEPNPVISSITRRRVHE